MAESYYKKQDKKGVRYTMKIGEKYFKMISTSDYNPYDAADVLATGYTNGKVYAFEAKCRNFTSTKYPSGAYIEKLKYNRLMNEYSDRLHRYICYYTDGVYFSFDLDNINMCDLDNQNPYCPHSTADLKDGNGSFHENKEGWYIPYDLGKQGTYEPE